MIFFFKQKTAYEMRISDWSSDVCVLDGSARARHRREQQHRDHRQPGKQQEKRVESKAGDERNGQPGHDQRRHGIGQIEDAEVAPAPVRTRQYAQCLRSEEHTSELQSLMRNSYAVFCLKKK